MGHEGKEGMRGHARNFGMAKGRTGYTGMEEGSTWSTKKSWPDLQRREGQKTGSLRGQKSPWYV